MRRSTELSVSSYPSSPLKLACHPPPSSFLPLFLARSWYCPALTLLPSPHLRLSIHHTLSIPIASLDWLLPEL